MFGKKQLYIIVSTVIGAIVLGAPTENVNNDATSHEIDSEVINYANATQFPFIVSLQFYIDGRINAEKFCSGSIVGDRWILTAAHCFSEALPTDVYINAGVLNAFDFGPKSENIRIAEVHLHPEFDLPSSANDICLLKLEERLNFTDTVKMIRVAQPGSSPENLKTGIVVGWGGIHPRNWFLSSDVVLYTHDDVIPISECEQSYGSYYVNENQICVNNPLQTNGPCVGDSGSPFVQFEDEKHILSGIVSYQNIQCTAKPTVFTRVSHYAQWISDTMEGKATSA